MTTRLYATAAAAAAVAIVVLQSDLSFWADEWSILVERRGFGPATLLEPHNEHIVAAPVAIYQLLLEVFGMDSPRPYQLAALAMHLAVATLTFIYVRRRCGGWVALAVGLPILVLGSSWLNLLFPFQITFTGALACGLGALLALDRGDRRGDVAACALLIAALAFNAVALGFVAAAAVIVAGGAERGRRAYIAGVPLALFALWWLTYGTEAETTVTLGQIATAPIYVLDGIASSLASLLGVTEATLNDADPSGRLAWGRALAALAAVAAVWSVHRRGGPVLWLVAALAALLTVWFLFAANESELRPPTSGRYQYVGVILLVLVGAELLRGVRLPRAALASIVAAGIVAAALNFTSLRDGYEQLRATSQQTRGALTGVELARDEIDPATELDAGVAISPLSGLTAANYLDAVDRFGSPAFAADELEEMPERSRAAADQTVAGALAIEIQPAAGGRPRGCRAVEAGAAPPALTLPPGGALIRARGEGSQLRLRRLAEQSFPVDLGTAPPGTSALAIPADRLDRPWELEVTGPAEVEICAPDAKLGA